MHLTYGLKTATDLLKKVVRDAGLLDEEVSSDKLFNFVVTAYSLIDWVKHDPAASTAAKNAVMTMYDDDNLRACGDICTASKHFRLTKRNPITQEVSSARGYGFGRYGVGDYGRGEEKITIEFNDGTSIDALAFVKGVVASWQEFFSKYFTSTLDEALQSKLADWAKSKPTIKALHVFGSYAEGAAGPKSDLDLAFDFLNDIDNELSELIDNAAHWKTELSELTRLCVKDFYLSSNPVAAIRITAFTR